MKLSGIANRSIKQNNRIEQGKASGSLTKKEAAKLEKKEAKLDKFIEKQLKDGFGLSPMEERRIERKQDRLSNKIHDQKHDGQRANAPVAEKRADRLEQRIEKGVASGELNKREAARLSNQVDAFRAAITDAGDGGKVTNREQKKLMGEANVLSYRTFLNKHD